MGRLMANDSIGLSIIVITGIVITVFYILA